MDISSDRIAKRFLRRQSALYGNLALQGTGEKTLLDILEIVISITVEKAVSEVYVRDFRDFG